MLQNSFLKLGALILAMLFGHFSNGQIIMQDSRGKDVFEYYKGGDLQATFVPSQISTQINYNAVIGNRSFFYVGDTTQKTVGVSHSISLIGKVTGSGTNEGKPYDVDNGLKRPAFRAEVGWQRNINTFYDIRLIPDNNRFTHAFGINFYGELQNVNFYDTLSQKQTNEKPFIYGIHTHANFFETRLGVAAISFSGDLYRSYNQDALIPYQERTGSTYIDPNIISTGSVLGNIGTFDKATAFRLRASLPIFIHKYVSFTPYTSYYGYLGEQTKNLTGFALNFFNGTPRDKKSSIAKGLGIGIDWEKIKDNWSLANISLYGSLDLELLKKAVVKSDKQKFLY